jgi:hypothetical protein
MAYWIMEIITASFVLLSLVLFFYDNVEEFDHFVIFVMHYSFLIVNLMLTIYSKKPESAKDPVNFFSPEFHV